MLDPDAAQVLRRKGLALRGRAVVPIEHPPARVGCGLPCPVVPRRWRRVLQLPIEQLVQLAGQCFGTVRADLSLALIESGLIVVAYAAALSIRSLDPSGLDPVWWGRLALVLPIIVLIHVGANILFGNYGHVWSYASVDEAVRVAGAAMTSGFVLIGIGSLYQLFSESAIVPLSVFVIGALLWRASRPAKAKSVSSREIRG